MSNAHEVDLSCYDYVVDCIDTVSAKMELVRRCKQLGVPILCCMGAANKFDATAFRIADISKTKNDPLAKVMRKRLRREGINHFKCVYSDELPTAPFDDADISCRFHCICPNKDMRKCTDRRNIPASNAFVPAAAGIIAGGEVVKDLIAAAGTMRISPQERATSQEGQWRLGARQLMLKDKREKPAGCTTRRLLKLINKNRFSRLSDMTGVLQLHDNEITFLESEREMKCKLLIILDLYCLQSTSSPAL